MEIEFKKAFIALLFSITVENISFTIIYINTALIWTKIIGKKINKTKNKPTKIVFKPKTKNFIRGFLRRTTFRAYIIKIYSRLTNFRPKLKKKA